MITLGSNILAQKIQRQLNSAGTALSSTFERLSTGQRINKGSDDAAGLAIALTLNTDSRIFTQGIRNLNDGLSLVSIAEGALGELSGIAIRIEELAEQASNGTFSNTQRQSLQGEVSALQSEWNRIVESTSFNGRRILTGENTRVVLQGGKGDEATLALEMGEVGTSEPASAATAGGTTRLSTNTVGGDPNATSYFSFQSRDGRFVVFESGATNLIAGDSNSAFDIFLTDLQAGTTSRVSTSSAGVQGDGHSSGSALSTDGRYLTFVSVATNLVAGDTNGTGDIFKKDLQTGITTRISTDTAGTQSAGSSNAPVISSDGRYIAFQSLSTDLVAGDSNGVQDIFLKDTQTGTTTRVSTSSAGVQGGASATDPMMSADGRYVVFDSASINLVAGDGNAARDVFMKDTQTGTTTRISTSSAGVEGNSYSYNASVSSDGRYVVFQSGASNLVAGDTNGAADVFIKDTQTGTTTRVSTDSSGAQSDGFSQGPTVSDNGRYVAFYSAATNLVAGDTNGRRDVFIKDLQIGTTTRMSVTAAGVQGNNHSDRPSISADGQSVAFESTASNLTSGDGNGSGDIFFAGFADAGGSSTSDGGVPLISGLDVSTQSSARNTLELAKTYRENISTYQARLGAVSSRIGTFVNTLESARLGYEGAYSRIADVDITHESAKAVALSIRQQVAASLSGQANLMPQVALSLLRT